MTEFDPLATEEQRARMALQLRDSKMALMITTTGDGSAVTMYFNASRLELLGLRELIGRHVDEMTYSDLELLDDLED